jgi:hypothetical protein
MLGSLFMLGSLYMIGNMDELALWEGVYPDEPVVNPYVDDSEVTVVTRGGNYNASYSNYSACRAASRHINFVQFFHGGLRPVRTLPGSDILDSEPPEPCPISESIESCESETDPSPPVFRAAAADERYVDIAHNNGYVMALGVSEAAGPFVEILEIEFGADPAEFVFE